MTLLADLARGQSDAPRHEVILPAHLAGTIAARVLRQLLAARGVDGVMAVPLSALAASLGTTPRQVRRSASALVATGVLEVVTPAQVAGRYAPKRYRLRPAGGVLSRGSVPGVTPTCQSVI